MSCALHPAAEYQITTASPGTASTRERGCSGRALQRTIRERHGYMKGGSSDTLTAKRISSLSSGGLRPKSRTGNIRSY